MMRISPAGDASERRVRREGGYTLLELLAVLSIIALMAGIVTAHWPGRRVAGNVRFEAYRIETAMRAARSQALTDGTSVAFSIDVANRSWRFLDRATLSADPAVSLSVYTGRSLIGAQQGVIVFFPNGESTGGHVIVSAGDRQQQIDVDWLTGRIHEHNDDLED